MEDIKQINVVKTNSVWYITDCLKNDSYSQSYHRTRIPEYYFSGKLPEVSFLVNWYKIDPNPTTIQVKQNVPSTNTRYELVDETMASEKLPLVIKKEDIELFSTNVLEALYKYKADSHDPILVDAEIEFVTLMEVEDFTEPVKISYSNVRKFDYKDVPYKVVNADVLHQTFDRMIFPEIMLHEHPCSMSSHLLFGIVRQYVKENIDQKVAKITSDYDFCFTVKKQIPLIEGKKYSYSNPFARTKKERSKVSFGVQTFKELEIFEMTHDQSKYQNYTVIPSMFANSEAELKEKIDNFLEDLIGVINQPLEQCKHCNGTGYTQMPVKFNTNEKIK